MTIFKPGEQYEVADTDWPILRNALLKLAFMLEGAAELTAEEVEAGEEAARGCLDALIAGLPRGNEGHAKVLVLSTLLKLGALGLDDYLKASQAFDVAVGELFNGKECTGGRQGKDHPGAERGPSEG